MTDSDKEWQKSDRLLQIVTDCYRKWQMVTDSDILLKSVDVVLKAFNSKSRYIATVNVSLKAI